MLTLIFALLIAVLGVLGSALSLGRAMFFSLDTESEDEPAVDRLAGLRNVE
ncbi:MULTISPECIES: hypothetical protein [Pseudomonas]|uniref:hypothetical protein n=1 Tax=Pseudomonas TaxID=286 RepID=UPI001C820FFE|nr:MULTISPECIES: hypothetical protein [Pseudomonas]MDG9931332.1 hypothetical protein [Pseudomonas sp. GD04042]MDH0484021.1 hypothetical protein [Pseudomonas sp. GD04015]MDH0607193.1 hypothetical protein [Pseudomonas sp. GD03869]MDH0896255.1 hypothetical protein [Pseudomonas sp. GD03875]MDH1064955.1 hypothetical protein [Pseudomonas sp. GD03985]